MKKSKSRPNPFSGQTFGALSKIAGAMIRKEYDYTGHDPHTLFMDLTEVLMSEHHDKTRDDFMRETIRGLVGKIQTSRGY